jgi:hypothetical protein
MTTRRLGSILLLLLCTLLANAQPNNKDQLIDKAPLEPGLGDAAFNISPGDPRVRSAYLDAFRILSSASDCSEFYGGPAIATTVLTDLIKHMKYGYLPTGVSFQMSGVYGYVEDIDTGTTYRRFPSAVVNYNGSFFKSGGISGPRVPKVGSFMANTRAARALILMHEVGHLIQKNGRWLIRDDGDDWWQSRANTELIEQTCRAELKELDK